uniref:Uncharacterized protein n=1 Tax=Rhizophora mucronata TaxID=61149 RepID=A0A2P2PTI8_RHIMU
MTGRSIRGSHRIGTPLGPSRAGNVSSAQRGGRRRRHR